ncbi:MAG: HlyC/CorC family transporter [Clostridia bacterium]|nr:HlyC/CorC family transporter [Clostridia bacterium]
MPDGSVPLLISLIVLMLFSGFFSATETAFSCANKIKLRSLSNTNKRAEKVLRLAEEKYDRLISTILIGNNLVNIAATTIATTLFVKIITSDVAVANIVSTVVMTVSVLIFGEITPKLIAKIRPEKTAMSFYPVIIIVYYLFFPLNLLFSGWRWLIIKIFRLKSDDTITEEEILTMVEEAEEDGTIKTEETNLIRSVIEFDDLEVGDILVPRVNIIAVNVESSMEEIRTVFEKEGYSRLLVYKNSIDTIIGTIHEKDFFNAYLSGKKSLDGVMQNAYYTTEHAKISKLLKILQKKRIHIAVVTDEYGGTLGLVTLEDILEELVGEIWDEHDQEETHIKPNGENVYLVDGNSNLKEMFEFFDMKEDDESFDANTVSGFVTEFLGEIPVAGKTFEYKNLKIDVMKSTVKRVLQIKVTVNKITEE